MNQENMPHKKRVQESVDELLPELRGLSEFLHDNPETAFNEYKASDKLRSIMEEKGFSVEKGIGGLETAFKAVYSSGSGAPVFAFIAEYDALPEIGHACGHNLIASMSAGAALAVKKVLAGSGLDGTVVLMGTPAEEKGGGKVILVDKGCFDGIDCALMTHPSSQTKVEDFTLASTRLVLKYSGAPAHAAAAPWNGANALEAVIQTFNLVNAWRSQLRDLSRINGIITSGGTAVNIIPEYAEASFGIRATNRAYLDELVGTVGLCAKNAAASMGVSVEITRMGRGYDAIMNNPVISALMASNLAQVEQEVVPRKDNSGLGSTDMGNVTQRLPSAHCYIKVRSGLETHTTAFAEACKGADAEKALAAGAKAMGMTAMDLFSNPSLLVDIRSAFDRQKTPE